MGSSTEGIEYTEEELGAMKQVKQMLLEEHQIKHVNPRFLAYSTIVCKNRPDETTKKIVKLLEVTKPCGLTKIESDEELWDDPDVERFLKEYYIPCGLDNEGRSIMWIRGKSIPLDGETTSIRAGILYMLAIHADVKSLREGITFVIDTSKGVTEKIGNEGRLQKVNQSYPLRPQAIYLAGASRISRIIINALIKAASLFTKQKILQRIKFVSLEEAVELVPKESGPAYLGGGSGGITDVVAWTKRRIELLPIPSL